MSFYEVFGEGWFRSEVKDKNIITKIHSFNAQQ